MLSIQRFLKKVTILEKAKLFQGLYIWKKMQCQKIQVELTFSSCHI